MVRFQAVKELNDAPSEVIIDYVPAGDTGGERQALALILRRELSQHLADAVQGRRAEAGRLVPPAVRHRRLPARRQ